MRDHDHVTASEATPPAPAVICSWCKRYLEDGTFPPSHGVCLDCLETRLHIPRYLIETDPEGHDESAA